MTIYDIKLWNGLWGCTNSGVIKTPSGKSILWLPPCIAFKLQAFLNKFSNIGLSELTEMQKIEIKQMIRDHFKEELNKAANPKY